MVAVVATSMVAWKWWLGKPNGGGWVVAVDVFVNQEGPLKSQIFRGY